MCTDDSHTVRTLATDWNLVLTRSNTKLPCLKCVTSKKINLLFLTVSNDSIWRPGRLFNMVPQGRTHAYSGQDVFFFFEKQPKDKKTLIFIYGKLSPRTFYRPD